MRAILATRFFIFLAFSAMSAIAKKKMEIVPKVFSIGAANLSLNWTAVELFSEGAWSVKHADLTGFGMTMHQQGFQTALDQFDDKLRRAIQLLKPSVVVVASKGLNILTHLADAGIYKGPSVLLSPIPNICNLVPGETWEEQWSASMSILVDAIDGPIGIGVGDSLNEQTLIKDMMDEAGVCGSLEEEADGRVSFRRCANWFLRSFPGDHGWKNQRINASNVASLIKEVLTMADRTEIGLNEV